MIFEQNIDLDAVLVKAAMTGGIHAYMNACFLRRDVFPDTNTAMARAEWFKKQPEEYLAQVTAKIIEIENK